MMRHGIKYRKYELNGANISQTLLYSEIVHGKLEF